MTLINWDIKDHPYKYHQNIKKVYDNEILKNRKKFTSWIGKISEFYFKQNLNWHISTPASRNPFVSDLYKNVCVTKTFLKLQKKIKNLKIIVYSKSHFDLLNSLKRRNNIEIILKKNFINFIFLKNFFKAIFFQTILLLFINLIIKKNKIKGKITLVDFFHIEENFYNNRYYKQISEEKFLKNKKIFFVPTLISGKGLFKTLKIIYKLKDNRNILFKEHFLTFKDLFKSILYYKNLFEFKKNYSRYDRIDFSKMIFEEIKSDAQVSTILISKLNYYFVQNLKSEKIRIKKIVNWFENQQIDRAWNFAFRKFYPDSMTLGYQGFTLYPQYMCAHPSKSEENCKVIPKKIIVIGKAFTNSRKEFFKQINIIQGPALTFQHIFKNKTNKEKNKNKILIILTGYLHLDKILVQWGQRVAEKISKKKIIIKPHPHLPIKKINLNEELNRQIHVSNLPLNKIFHETKVVVSCGPTSATIESLAYGSKLIIPILDINDKLILDMIKINKNTFDYANNEDQLISNIKKITRKKVNFNLKKEKLLILRKYLFNKANDKNLRLFY